MSRYSNHFGPTYATGGPLIRILEDEMENYLFTISFVRKTGILTTAKSFWPH